MIRFGGRAALIMRLTRDLLLERVLVAHLDVFDRRHEFLV